MAIVKTGTITATGSALNLNLGFVPSRITVWNDTKLASGTGIFQSTWFNTMPNASAYTITTAGTPVFAKATTNGYTPYQTPDSGLWIETNLSITGISNAAQAVVQATNSFTSADYGVTVVTFSGVQGMPQINTLRGTVIASTGSSFTVNINTTAFSTYVTGGIANIITGIPAYTLYSNTQYLNTAQANEGQIGITLGSAICGSSSDVLNYEAVLDASFTSD